jgi:DNA polymerase-3 subunit gamma/tau
MLTREAFNALLKTLEEPPAHVHFILATTEPHKIPLTILSRCQRYDFRRLSLAKLVEHLEEICHREGVSITREALEIIAKEAEGSVRDALSLLDQAISSGVQTKEDLLSLFGLADKLLVEELARYIVGQDLGNALLLLNRAFEQGVDLLCLFEDLIIFFRNLIAVKSTGRALELPEADLKAIRNLSLESEIETLLVLFEILLKGLEHARRSPVPKLSLELALAKACQVSQIVPLERIFEKLNKLKDLTHSPREASPPVEGSSEEADWPTFVAQVKERSPSLGALLEDLATPRITEKELLLKVPQGCLLEGKDYQERLAAMVRESLGRELRLEFEAQESSLSQRQRLVQNPLVQEALKIFGGRIAQVKIYEKE